MFPLRQLSDDPFRLHLALLPVSDNRIISADRSGLLGCSCGRLSARPQLDAALAAARARRVPVVVAKVDRLTRSVAFLSRLLEAGVDVRFADLPMIEGATGFLLQQMAAVAELEAGMISARTKAALAAAKRRGVKLGGDRGARLTAKARAAGRAALQERARNRAADLASTIKELQAAGCESLRAIAAGLEERGIPAARGGKWSAVQVARLLEDAGFNNALLRAQASPSHDGQEARPPTTQVELGISMSANRGEADSNAAAR